MNTTETQGRPLVFVAVLLSHVLVVLLAIRTSQPPTSLPDNVYEPLLILDLRGKPRSPASNVRSIRRRLSADTAKASPPEILVPAVPPQSRIDWEYEAELAAETGVAGAEKEKTYRDLSAPSPAQLDWIRRNRMQPAPPGIHWTHPRVEIQNGFPVIWINDHCVAIPLMVLAVFCAIGHIEPNGDLFKHMRDPHEP